MAKLQVMLHTSGAHTKNPLGQGSGKVCLSGFLKNLLDTILVTFPPGFLWKQDFTLGLNK